MTDRVFVDTNVVAYLFDDDSPAKQAQARRAFLSDGVDHQLVLSTQVLQEFFVTVTRKLERPLPFSDALRAVRSLGQLPVVQIDTPMIELAMLLCRDHPISFWEALIVRAAITGGCKKLFTEDMPHGYRFNDLVVEDPFTV